MSTNNLLVIGIIATIVAILVMLAMSLFLGDLGGVKAPRTYTERQIGQLELIAKQKPSVARVWADLAKALIESGQFRRADEILRQGAVAATDDKSVITVEQARLAYRQGDIKTAQKLIDKTITEANKYRAGLLEQYRKKGIAVSELDIPMDPIITACILRAVIYREAKDYGKAADALTVALKEKSNMADVLTERGTLYIELKKYDLARADLEKALTFIPDYSDALKALERLKAVSGS